MIADHLTYCVSWSRSDNEFVASCSVFPSLSWLAGDHLEALEGIKQLVRKVIDDMAANGESDISLNRLASFKLAD